MRDENGNGKMDSNLLGIPLEGYATSNTVPHSMIGPPRFKDAELEMRGTSAIVHIKMLYRARRASHDKGVARSMIAPAAWQTHPDRIREFVSAFSSFDRRAAATTVRTVLTRSPGLEGVLPKLAVPTTILMGEEDRICPVDRLRGLAARLAPGATLEIVPSCGHLAPLETPEAVVAALQRLAADARRRGAELHQDAVLT